MLQAVETASGDGTKPPPGQRCRW